MFNLQNVSVKYLLDYAKNCESLKLQKDALSLL